MSAFTFIFENETFDTPTTATGPAPPSGALPGPDATATASNYRNTFIGGGNYVPPEQKPALNADSTAAAVPITQLKITPEQCTLINTMYHPDSSASFSSPLIDDHIFPLDIEAQDRAAAIMTQYGLDNHSREQITETKAVLRDTLNFNLPGIDST
ncbi:hypothetical protein B0H17DRAFT_1219544 [Mycena rosella]|uniref:Uncharacterized protein n=1 Tax=Mycena rosella TaxID=1033263 RepID=A0AAD7FHJ8_MYCRO|nr:hypothetical protein B0H17DRAFT_1219544 [Mycena rosella]